VKHFYEEIEGWFQFSKPYLEAVASARDGAVFVELGCWKGRSASFMGVEIVNSGKAIEFNCVDHWKGSDDVHLADTEIKNIAKIFRANMKRIDGLNLVIHRSESPAAAEKFADESCDFVWIDAGHDYASVLADINAWLPKVKRGGVIGGDDYPMDGVGQAVREVFPKPEIGTERGWSWWRVRKV